MYILYNIIILELIHLIITFKINDLASENLTKTFLGRFFRVNIFHLTVI